MEIFDATERPSRRGPADYFTGTVWLDEVMSAPPPASVRILRVSFEPGARTAWHTHPRGQTLHVLSGAGLVQSEGNAVRQIRAGDTVWIAPGEKHWHGAAAQTAMVHMAVQETVDGISSDWLTKVTDEEYSSQP